jgi:hypothetical protein
MYSVKPILDFNFNFNKTSDSKRTLPVDISNEYISLSIRNRSLLEESEICGCYFCEEIFKTEMIDVYVDTNEITAICPFCCVDSIISINIDDYNENRYEYKELLSRLHNTIFNRYNKGDIRIIIKLVDGRPIVVVCLNIEKTANGILTMDILTQYYQSPSFKNKYNI